MKLQENTTLVKLSAYARYTTRHKENKNHYAKCNIKNIIHSSQQSVMELGINIVFFQDNFTFSYIFAGSCSFRFHGVLENLTPITLLCYHLAML